MSIIDAFLRYSDGQALTATAVSTNVIDHSSDRNLGIGTPLVAVIIPSVALAGTTPTLYAELETSDTEAFTVATVVSRSGSYTALAIGEKIILNLPPDSRMQQYSRIRYTLGGTTPTVTVDAFLTKLDMIGTEGVYYADNITITG